MLAVGATGLWSGGEAPARIGQEEAALMGDAGCSPR
jgi:hypothetical protein